MNINALKISLKSLIEKGNEINNGKVNNNVLREYIATYHEIKKYLITYINDNKELQIPYNRLPDLEHKTFGNIFYLFKSFLVEKVKWGYEGHGGLRINELFDDVDPYPARTRYLNELTVSILNINKIVSELIKSIEEKR